MTTAKRVYLYLVSLVALVILAVGTGRLLGLLLALPVANRGVALVGGSFDTQQLSLSLAMILIGGGVWWGFWYNIRNKAASDSAEIGAAFRKLYLNFVQALSALIGLAAAIDAFNWLFGGLQSSDYPPMRLATLAVASVVWYFHWRLSEREGHPSPSGVTLRRWYVYILSGWGLTLLAVNVVQFISNTVSFLPFWDPALVSGNYWNTAAENLSGTLVGGITWWFFWFKMARRDAGSTLRQVYYYLFAIPGSAIAGLVALTNMLYGLTGYFVGLSSGGAYFRFLNWTLPAALVAAGIWFYHQHLAQEEAEATDGKTFSARRIYLYLMSFISLGTLVAGLVVLIGILLDWMINAVSPGIIISSSNWWQGQLSASLALLIVGVPIWVYFWSNVLKMMLAGGDAECRARSRRIFLYVILGASILASVAALVNLVYLLINALFQGGTADLLRSIKWSIQSLAVSIPVLLYFWGIVRADQKLGAETVAAHKDVTLIVADSETGMIKALEAALGYRLKVLHSLSGIKYPDASDDEITSIVNQIQLTPGRKIMLVATSQGWLVIPYSG
jgi:hypothetical protein